MHFRAYRRPGTAASARDRKNLMRLKLQQSEMRASQRSYAIAIPNIGRS
jgi:hypothetical protein